MTITPEKYHLPRQNRDRPKLKRAIPEGGIQMPAITPWVRSPRNANVGRQHEQQTAGVKLSQHLAASEGISGAGVPEPLA